MMSAGRTLSAALAALAFAVAPAAADAAEHSFGGKVKGEPDSSITFDALGNKKGTKFTSTYYLAMYTIPLECNGAPDASTLFYPNEEEVENGKFRVIQAGPGLLIEIRGTFENGKATGTIQIEDEASGCETDGKLKWSAKRV